MAVVHRFLDAANHHDSDTLYATVHPEFESFQPLHPDRDFRGPGQLISNWKAIFEAEPGFRLTVLRASTTGNTVWVELHGAGDSAEAAGIFIVGVENGRIRWVRVYSDLVEAPPEEELPESAGRPDEVAAEPSVLSFVYASDIIERPGAGDGARSTPTPVGQADDGDSGSVGSGALRLVEGSQESEPDAASESAAAPDPGLRLVDPSAAEAGGVIEGPESDAGPVETLVGPSRSFPTPSPPDETTPLGASLADLWGDKGPGGGDAPPPDSAFANPRDDSAADAATTTDDAATTTDDAADIADIGDIATDSAESTDPADADQGGDESAAGPDLKTTTDDSPPPDVVNPDTDTGAESEPESGTEEPSSSDDERDPPAPRSYDTGHRQQEPRLSRWRKALRKD